MWVSEGYRILLRYTALWRTPIGNVRECKGLLDIPREYKSLEGDTRHDSCTSIVEVVRFDWIRNRKEFVPITACVKGIEAPTVQYLGIVGVIWGYLGLFGVIRGYLGLFGVSVCVDLCMCVCALYASGIALKSIILLVSVTLMTPFCQV